MSDSIRKQVFDKIETVLNASTSISHVTQDLQNWWDWEIDKFPGVTIIDKDSEVIRLAYNHATSDDRTAKINMAIRGYIHTFDNDEESKQTKRTNLIRAIDLAMETDGSTTLRPLIQDIKTLSIETDEGIIDNFSIFDVIFEVEYDYNHFVP